MSMDIDLLVVAAVTLFNVAVGFWFGRMTRGEAPTLTSIVNAVRPTKATPDPYDVALYGTGPKPMPTIEGRE